MLPAAKAEKVSFAWTVGVSTRARRPASVPPSLAGMYAAFHQDVNATNGTSATSGAYPGLCVTSFEDGERKQEHAGGPCGQDAEAGPWRDRQ